MNETTILAKAGAIGVTAPGKCPKCISVLVWDRADSGWLGISCSSTLCDYVVWFSPDELTAMEER